MSEFPTLSPTGSGDTLMISSDMVCDEGYGTMTATSPSKDRPVSRGADLRNGLEIMAKKPKELMESIKEFRHLGIEAVDLPLPKICVVGDQSTGKSSLIEGISEIRVPRSADTCTRCPLEINLTESVNAQDPWTCNVFLTKKYTYSTGARKEGASRAKPLGPWHEQSPEDVHFATLSNKEEVGPALNWAQLATLNPGVHPDVYKPGNNEATPRKIQVPFSPNVVRLDISGPGLPNLSFYDLPGVINQDEEGYVVDLVKNLVKEYIRPDNCIILHTLTMNHDAANSSSAAIINQMKAESRTVGVLTKPDCVDQTQSIKQWREILEGSRFRRELGYYVVKNNIDVNVSHATARQEEREFFVTTEPFKTELKHLSHRFGTMRLQAALSEMLTLQIKKSLPIINAKIIEKAELCQERLSQLPEPVKGNVSLEINNKILGFQQILKSEIDGGSIESSFFTAWHETAKAFRNELVESKPRLVIGENRSSASQRSSSQSESRENVSASRRTVEPITLSSGEEAQEPTPTRRNKRSKQGAPKRTLEIRTPTSSSKRQRVGAQSMETIPAYDSGQGDVDSTPRRPMMSAPQNYSRHSKRFKLEEIRTMINSVNTGLPGSRNPKVTEKMHKESIAHWPELIHCLIEDTRTMCENLIDHCIRSSFSLWQETRLYETIVETVKTFVDRSFMDQGAAVHALLKMEMSKVMTFNREEKDAHEREILKQLLEHSKEARFRVEREQMVLECEGANLRQDQVKQLREKVNNEPEPYQLEIQEMATVRSYYYCASQRFADYVGLSICTGLFAQCRDELPKAIIEGLGLNRADANQNCERLLAFDSQIEDERARLKAELEKLEKAQALLTDLLDGAQQQE